MIEEHGIRFLLTGSSARALKRKGVNMLGGRGSDRVMHPFSWSELGERSRSSARSTTASSRRTTCPPIRTRDWRRTSTATSPRRVAAEGLARNLPRFARFLQTAATTNAQMLNYSNVGRDAQVPRQTVVQVVRGAARYAHRVRAAGLVENRQAQGHRDRRVLFFDTGVVRTLRRPAPVSEASADFGEFFEHFLFLELRAWIDYRQPRTPLAYWRSRSGYEVDFILDDRVAIEAKAARLVQRKHPAESAGARRGATRRAIHPSSPASVAFRTTG